MKSIIRIFLLLFTICLAGFSQKWEAGVGVGLMNYKGDLSPNYKPLDGRPATNVFVKINKDRAISYRFGADAGRIIGSDMRFADRFQKLRGYSFKANIFDANARIEYNFLNFRVSQARNQSNWTPYAYLGLGATYRQMVDFKANVVANPIPATYDSGKNLSISMPYGVGFKKKWKGPWNFGAEFGSYKMMSLSKKFLSYDYLDGLGPEVADVSNRLQTTNKDLGDWYFYTNFYISYVFYKIACPK